MGKHSRETSDRMTANISSHKQDSEGNDSSRSSEIFMIKSIASVLLYAVVAALAFSAPAPARGTPAKTDYQATRQYYDSLIAGPSPNLAALTLLMTMMPKGGDLHHHYAGAIYVENFLDWIKQKAYCIYRADNSELKAIRFRVETKPGGLSPVARALCLDVDQVRDPSNQVFYQSCCRAGPTRITKTTSISRSRPTSTSSTSSATSAHSPTTTTIRDCAS